MYYLFDHYHHQIIIILSCFAKNSHWNNELTDLSFFHIQCLKLRESVALMNFQGQLTRRLLTWLCRKSCLERTNVSTRGLKFNNVSSTWNFGVHASIIFIITFQVHCRIFTVVWTQYLRYPSSFYACKDFQVKNKVTWFLRRQTTDKSCHYKLSTEQQQKVKILQFQKRHWQTMGGGDLCLDNGLYWKPLLFLCSLWNHVKFLLSHQFLGAFTKWWVSRMRSISIWKHWVYKEYVSGNKVY